MKDLRHGRRQGVFIGLFIGITFFLTGVILTQAQEPPLRIGGTVPITGKIAHFGAWTTRGVQMALDDLAQKGWVGGKKIEVIWEDNEYEPRKAISAFNKLAFVDKVNTIICSGSPIVRALAPLAEKNKVVQLYTSTSNEEIKKSGVYTFKIMGGQVTECLALAKYARDNLKSKDAGVIHLDTEYGTGGVKLFEKYFTKMGGRVVATEMVRTGERDYNSVLMRIQGKNPDVIVIINASVEGGYVVKQAKRLGIKAQLLGGMNLYSSETLTSAGEDAEGLYAVAYQFDPKFGTPKMKEFSANFEKRFGGFPPIITAVAFDAVMLYAEAAKQGAKSSDDIKKVVQGIKNYEGVSGTISFDSWSENMPTHRIMLVKGGQFVEDHVFEKFSEKDM